MSGAGRIADLSQIGELRLTLEQRPPRIVHATVLLLAALLLGAVAWSALTHADLVVRGPARVRASVGPYDRFEASQSGDQVSAQMTGRVKEIFVRDGVAVRAGDRLFAVGTERLDLEIGRSRRLLSVRREELAGLEGMRSLLAARHAADLAKIDAELGQVSTDQRGTRAERAVEVRLAELEIEQARGEEARIRTLREGGATAPAELDRASARVRDAEARLSRAQLPPKSDRAAVLRKERERLERDFAYRQAELQNSVAQRRGEVEGAESSLAALELDFQKGLVRAPIDGVVSLGSLRAGDHIEMGRPVLTVAPERGFRVDAAISAADVARVKLGMRAHVRLDAFDNNTYGRLEGTLQHIAADAQLSGDGRGYPSYLVSLKIDALPSRRGGEPARLKLGLVGQVEIVTGRRRLLTLLVDGVREGIRLD